jgi:integrase
MSNPTDLTSDNLHLSGLTNSINADQTCAINCTNQMSEAVLDLVRDSLAESTRRAYRCDIAAFEVWGGTIPASPATVAAYLADHAERLSVATLVRRIASISKAHEARTVSNPCRSQLVRATMRGIKRRRGCGQDQAKPLLKEDLFQVLDAMGDGPKATRDRALLLIGFAGGFRRSEIVGLDVADLEKVRQGLIVHLRRSKTDQDGTGRKIGIPFGRTRFCPVLAAERWLEVSGIETGAIFRRINRHGQIAPGRLSGDAVAVIIKDRVTAAGLDPIGFSGHSLRAGFATSAAQAGVSTWKIRAQTGHASDAMLARYVRDGEIFVGNAAASLL